MSPDTATRAHTRTATGPGSFEERLQTLLRGHDQDRAARLRDVADTMAGREEATAAFERVKPLLAAGLVRPRLEALAARFPNATLQELDTPGGVHTCLVFARTDRTPAKATLAAGALLDAERSVASAFTRVELIPVLVAVPGGAHRDVALETLLELAARGDDASADVRAEWAAVTAWLDEQLLAFVRLYLSVETDAGYQQMATHVDPVCGMRVHAGNTALTRDYLGHRYYLCSEACDGRFMADPGFYVNQRREQVQA